MLRSSSGIFSKPVNDLLTPGRVKAEMQYGNLRISTDRAWPNPGQLHLTLCPSPHLGAGSHPAPAPAHICWCPAPSAGNKKSLSSSRNWQCFVAWHAVSNRIPFCRVALPAQLQIALRFYFDKILSSSNFPQRSSKAPTFTTKGFKDTPWDMPCDG